MYLKNIKAAKRSSVFVLAIFVCWLPYALWLVSDTITSKKWISFDHEVYIVLLMWFSQLGAESLSVRISEEELQSCVCKKVFFPKTSITPVNLGFKCH